MIPLLAPLDEHVRPEVQALAKRGNITLAEYGQFRGNSWEHEHIVPALNDEAFAHYAAHNLLNCSRHPRPFSTYGEACSGLMAPELLRRWHEARAEVERLTNNQKATTAAINARLRSGDCS